METGQRERKEIVQTVAFGTPVARQNTRPCVSLQPVGSGILHGQQIQRIRRTNDDCLAA